ncbi:MAG: division/cell wall cluster transcriptional repressor MraZ [Methanomicrobia archaeon]|nr:division/cell wall cluster transcriptional repressor MraZ [Bacilli bacterium]NCA96062.1 division/cell wall cluster transcriptional repressor MraZ [Methanomicrobia archaeon]
MFFGSYSHTLDNKGRLVIPSKMRNEAGGRLYILKGYEGSLSVYKEADFQILTTALENLSYNQRDARDVQRIALSSVVELEVDAQGRIQLPSRLLTDYKISRSVVVVGVINHFEIWDASAWEKYLQQNEKDYEAKAEKLPVQ